jgi:peptide deformylase
MSWRLQSNKKFLSNKCKKCKDEEIDNQCASKINMMLIALKDHAVGLAANQIFMTNRVFGINDNGKIIIFINPEIEILDDSTFDSLEGCLSIKNGTKQYKVQRYNKVKIKSNNQEDMIFDGYMSTVVQHEMDHLNGILISNK